MNKRIASHRHERSSKTSSRSTQTRRGSSGGHARACRSRVRSPRDLEVDGVGSSPIGQEQNPTFDPDDGPRQQGFGHRPVGGVEPVLERERLVDLEGFEQRFHAVSSNGSARPRILVATRTRSVTSYAVEICRLALARHPTIGCGENVRGAVGPLLAEAGVEPPRPGDAHLERSRGEAREVDGVLLRGVGVVRHRPRRGVESRSRVHASAHRSDGFRRRQSIPAQWRSPRV